MRGNAGSTESSSKSLEYTLELDLHLFFTPLMQEYGDGIVMTRTTPTSISSRQQNRDRRAIRLRATGNHLDIVYVTRSGMWIASGSLRRQPPTTVADLLPISRMTLTDI